MLALKNIITSCLRTGLLFGMLGMAFMPDVIAPPHSGGAIVSTSVPQERVFGHETLHVVGAPLAPIPAESQIRAALSNLRAVKPLPPALIDSETLWLARLVYSESKRIEEQELVAWVARNRAETGYRGKRTYERIALDPFQFSAFNAGSATHGYYSSLDARAKAAGWQKALALAYYVRYAGEDLRPFSRKTRHFYSEQSFTAPGERPEWADGMEPVTPRRPIHVEPRRFRFYANVP